MYSGQYWISFRKFRCIEISSFRYIRSNMFCSPSPGIPVLMQILNESSDASNTEIVPITFFVYRHRIELGFPSISNTNTVLLLLLRLPLLLLPILCVLLYIYCCCCCCCFLLLIAIVHLPPEVVLHTNRSYVVLDVNFFLLRTKML